MPFPRTSRILACAVVACVALAGSFLAVHQLQGGGPITGRDLPPPAQVLEVLAVTLLCGGLVVWRGQARKRQDPSGRG